MRRYKVIYDQVEAWSSAVPWLAESKSPKAAKRVAVARALKDVVQFHESVWKAHLESHPPLSPPNDEEDMTVSSPDVDADAHVDTPREDERSSLPLRPQKKRKTRHIDNVSRFLLSPHDGSESPKGTPVPSLDVVSHVLTTDNPSFNRPPTRLQLLAGQKGAEAVEDDELFADGEMEGFLRTEQEREAIMLTFDWARDSAENAHPDSDSMSKREPDRVSRSRVNIEALNRLLDGTEAGWQEPVFDTDDDWMRSVAVDDARLKDANLGATHSSEAVPNDVGCDGEQVEPWRPISPEDDFSAWRDLARYEED